MSEIPPVGELGEQNPVLGTEPAQGSVFDFVINNEEVAAEPWDPSKAEIEADFLVFIVPLQKYACRQPGIKSKIDS